MWKGELRPRISLRCICFLSVPPPHRRHLARSLPVPRGSMHTGGFLSRLALSGAAGQITQHNAKQGQSKENKLTADFQGKHQIHFAALPVKLHIQYECCCSLFQETHFASQLLPPFGLIDKKLRQFFRARVYLQDQMQEARWFLFLLKWWPCCCVLFSNSRNHPILPAPNTQTWT